MEMYAGHFVVMTPEVYAKAYGAVPQDNAIFVQFKDKDAASVQKAAADLMAIGGVKAVVQNTSMVSRIDSDCLFIESCDDDFNGRIDFISSRYPI